MKTKIRVPITAFLLMVLLGFAVYSFYLKLPSIRFCFERAFSSGEFYMFLKGYCIMSVFLLSDFILCIVLLCKRRGSILAVITGFMAWIALFSFGFYTFDLIRSLILNYQFETNTITVRITDLSYLFISTVGYIDFFFKVLALRDRKYNAYPRPRAVRRAAERYFVPALIYFCGCFDNMRNALLYMISGQRIFVAMIVNDLIIPIFTILVMLTLTLWLRKGKAEILAQPKEIPVRFPGGKTDTFPMGN